MPIPKLPVDEYRPKTIGDTAQGDELIFDFEREKLSTVIKIIGARTGKNFDIDPALADMDVQLITHAPIPADMAFDILRSILQMRGYEIIEVLDGYLYRIRQQGQDPDQKDIIYHDELSPDKPGYIELPDGYHEVSTHILPIYYSSASDLAQLLPQLGSGSGRVDVYEKTNMLILSDTVEGIRNMLRFIQEVDVPGYDTVMKVFTLEYTRAEVLAEQIQNILGIDAGAGGATGGRGAPQPPRVRPPTRPSSRRAQVPGQPSSTVVSHEEILRLVTDERLNALIVLANEGLMERVGELVELLDCPTDTETDNLHVYKLLNADAETIAEALNGVIGLPVKKETQQQGGPSAEIQPFEKKVLLTAYEANNSLLIVASPQDYRVIQELIAELDVPARQVHIDAIIMQVGINDDFNLSVEAMNLGDTFALNNIVNIANVMSGGPIATAGEQGVGSLMGIIDGTTEYTVSDGAGGVVTQTVPNIPFLLTLLDSVTDSDILSQPGLTTKDNEEASVVVGEEVPFITGSSRSLDQSAVGASVFSRVERKDVGIRLLVTPQISEGDYVSMDLEVEVSKPIVSSVGADPNIVGPTIQKAKVETKVVIPDGSTGILGGLISESTSHSIRQTPFLGDLPMLGWMFRNKTNKRDKRNLVMLVTPYILKEGRELEELSKQRVEQFNEANIDVLFEKGYIKKIKKRREMRKSYRPSQRRSEEILIGGGSSFSRTDRGEE